ncbi:MAG: hypothetical protein L3J49_13735 [Desulfobulbaceae bacterium]|nr:hypothetical protein [Desulfobulbaceae bacterium]
MEVNMNALATQEMSLNKAQVGEDILQKTLAKAEEARSSNQSVERPETSRVTKGEGRTIDTYA